MKLSLEQNFDDYEHQEAGVTQERKASSKIGRKLGGANGKVMFTKEEERFVLQEALKVEQASHEYLADLARRCNIRFHDKKKIRNGPNLWWFFKRKINGHNQFYTSVKITGTSPKGKILTGEFTRTAAESVVFRDPYPVVPDNFLDAKAPRKRSEASKQTIVSNPRKEPQQQPVATSSKPLKPGEVISAAIKPVLPPRVPQVNKAAPKAPQKTQGGNKEVTVLEVLIRNSNGNIQKVQTTKFSSIEELIFALA
jgi:hypothetical protein